jgi:hypothetical protein
MIADAYQYELSQGDRFAQGWGLPDLGNMYNIGKNHYIDNENNALQTGGSVIYKITPTTATPLKISLVWTDVPGTTSAAKHLVNDLNLKVTDPDGTVYLGNYGLDVSKWSAGGGEADELNNVENVFVQNPKFGVWTVEVTGANIPMDAVERTIETDQSYALVASGVTRYDHDLRVQSIGLPEFVGVGENVVVNASILNIGFNNESNVKVEMLVENVTVDTEYITEIDIGETIIVHFNWKPEEVGQYYVSISIEPLSGETSIWDNRFNGITHANIINGLVLVDDGHGTESDLGIYYFNLETMGPEKYRVHHTAQAITATLLANYEVFITAAPTQSYTNAELAAIEAFVDSGGGLFVMGERDQGIYVSLTAYAGINWDQPYIVQYDGTTTEINEHEITEDVNSLYFDSPQLPIIVTGPAEPVVYT